VLFTVVVLLQVDLASDRLGVVAAKPSPSL
jgi:hypothetical protein